MTPLYLEIDIYLHDLIIFFDKKDVTEQQMKKLCTKSFKYSDEGKQKAKNSCIHFMKQYQSMIDNEYGGIATSYGHTCLIIFDEFNYDKAWFHSIVAHEVSHAVFKIMNRVGMKYSEESEESFTYLTGFIIKKIYRHLIDNMKGQKDEEAALKFSLDNKS